MRKKGSISYYCDLQYIFFDFFQKRKHIPFFSLAGYKTVAWSVSSSRKQVVWWGKQNFILDSYVVSASTKFWSNHSSLLLDTGIFSIYFLQRLGKVRRSVQVMLSYAQMSLVTFSPSDVVPANVPSMSLRGILASILVHFQIHHRNHNQQCNSFSSIASYIGTIQLYNFLKYIGRLHSSYWGNVRFQKIKYSIFEKF